ncbi:MAG TPA: hypothetical protein VFZ41_00200 [Solirubrobacterales bacterium]
MHDDPTRVMGDPGGGRPHGNVRLLVAGLIAVIVGLVIAIVVIAGDNGEDGTAPTTEATLPTTTEPTTTTDTTEPTTTTETTTPPTTTETTTVPEEAEEGGSGGIEAP